MSEFKRLYQEKFTEIGLIRRSHGYKGHAKLSIADSYIEDLKKQEFVFIEIDGYKVPFRIEELNDEKDLIIKLKGCESSEAISKYQLLTLHLLTRDISLVEEHPLTRPHALVDMHIHDINEGNIGQIIRVDEYPQQLMAIILIDQKEVMIPLHKTLIKEISHDDQIIKMDLPEGLI